MAPRKPAKPTEPEFPPECCGVCSRAIEQDGGEFLRCMAEPPRFLHDGDEIVSMRGGMVEPNEPACIHFKPRCHA